MSVWDTRRRETLRELATTFEGRSIVVIVAVALAHHLEGFRGTYDLDLCIALGTHEHLTAALPPGWSRVERMPHRWRTASSGIVDVIPAMPELLRAGHVEWQDGSKLDLTGIDVAVRDAEPISVELPRHVGVASLRALFLCEIAAWLDRSADRERDLGDLAVILDRYVETYDVRIFDDPTLDASREFDERPAFLLGVDLRQVCKDAHRARIRQFAARVTAVDRSDHANMMRLAPIAWRSDPTAITRRLAALQHALGE